jgi:hypothetical protein
METNNYKNQLAFISPEVSRKVDLTKIHQPIEKKPLTRLAPMAFNF